MRLDEMQPLSDSTAALIARAIVNAHSEAAKVERAELDDIRKQQYNYLDLMLQRARWNKQRRIEEGEL